MKRAFIIFITSTLYISCAQNRKNIDDPETRTQETIKNSFFDYLQNPKEIAVLIPGIEFDVKFLHDPTRFIDYTGNDIKSAANLGIYLSDLNYCILNNQSSYTKQYFNASYELSKVLRAEKRILEFLMKRYEENINQNDSVKQLMNQLLSESTLGLRGTDRERLIGISMAAYQVENLHLALSTIQSFPETLTDKQIQTRALLLQFVLDQRPQIELIYSFIRANSDPLDPDRNPNYPFYDNALRELIRVYQHVTTDDPKITEIYEKVSVIRNKMVQIE